MQTCFCQNFVKCPPILIINFNYWQKDGKEAKNYARPADMVVLYVTCTIFIFCVLMTCLVSISGFIQLIILSAANGVMSTVWYMVAKLAGYING